AVALRGADAAPPRCERRGPAEAGAPGRASAAALSAEGGRPAGAAEAEESAQQGPAQQVGGVHLQGPRLHVAPVNRVPAGVVPGLEPLLLVELELDRADRDLGHR